MYNRFGEYDETMSAEERMLQRFQHERMNRHERSGAFNLPDPEESLTHGGQVSCFPRSAATRSAVSPSRVVIGPDA